MSNSDVSSAITSAATDDDSKADADPPPRPTQGTSPTPTPTSAPSPPMEESTASSPPNAAPSPTPITFSLWPPSKRTRDAVIARLIETLCTPSVLSKRYGTLPQDEASEVARAIEEEAFNAAGGASKAAPDDEGLQILQIYSKEISKRMLDSVKARSAASEGGNAAGDALVVNEKGADEEKADSEVTVDAEA
ncbi:hypothetical protein MLD38_024727 [Melastoma candidum]|uniref:Uncharacterized protein n=1 Tax=Melastoma candidum TaxID=119954 RepID=A0ACB9NVZ5_9MYRT|nr:hypothetical protein MLD38_024727 [Melastoma candidum]